MDAVQPYFAYSPFFNVSDRFRRWSFHVDPDAHFRPTLVAHPQMVVYTVEFAVPGQMRNQWAPVSRIPSAEDERDLPRDLNVRALRAHGYRETYRFCGD